MSNPSTTPVPVSAEELDTLELDQFSNCWKFRPGFKNDLETEVISHQINTTGKPEGESRILTPHNIRQTAFASIDHVIEKTANDYARFDRKLAQALEESNTLYVLQTTFYLQLKKYLQALAQYTEEKKEGVTPATQAQVTNTAALVMRQLEAHPLLAHPRSLQETRHDYGEKIDKIRKLLVGLGYDPFARGEEVYELTRLWKKAEPRSLRSWANSTHFCAVFDDQRGDQSLRISNGYFGLRELLMIMSSQEDIQLWYIEDKVRSKVGIVLSNGGYEEHRE